MINLQNIRIVGGVHTNRKYLTQLTEEDLQKMIDEISSVIKKHISEEAWLTIEYKKSYGHKINS